MKAGASVKLARNKKNGDNGLISILEDIQLKYGYLPQESLKNVSFETGHPLTEVFNVATFYKFFRLKPVGKHMLTVCLGTACHVRGAPSVVEEFERRLKIKAGETTLDKLFTLETVNCLGACAIGPIVVADGRVFSNVHVDQVKNIIKEYSK